MVNLGIIGCGYWGTHLVRNYHQTDNCRVKTVSDTDIERQNFVRENYDDIRITANYEDIFDDAEINAVVIATPPLSHYSIAKKALVSNKHIFVEKPLALSYKDAFDLVETAQNKAKKLMVGHTVIFNDAIEMIKEILNSGEIGEVYYAYASRLNLGKVRSDVNVMWNLAPHDVSVLLFLLDHKPISVSARGFSYIQSNVEDVVYLNISFENKVNAQIHLSWLDPNKKRELTIVGSKKMLVYDDISDERIKIYDKGIDKHNKNLYLGEFKDYGEYQLIQRAGDVMIPKVNINEPLKKECQHFIDCIIEDREPITNGRASLDVIRVLEAADKSLKNSGREVILNQIQ
jgi:predicted dehydrogenase